MKKALKLLIVAVVLFSLFSCEKPTDFRDASISAKVDSVIVYKGISDPDTHYILINEKWYELPTIYYGDFIIYVQKGDSLHKEPGRWDLYVFKKDKNGKYQKKYFDGAQKHWD